MNYMPSIHQTNSREPTIVDLRRRRQGASVGVIIERAAHLPPAERHLLLAAYRDRKSMVELAGLLGARPRELRRRCKSLARRVLDPVFEYVAEHRATWGPTRRSVGMALFVQGLSMRRAMAHLNLTQYMVRRHRDAICAMASGAEEQARRAARCERVLLRGAQAPRVEGAP